MAGENRNKKKNRDKRDRKGSIGEKTRNGRFGGFEWFGEASRMEACPKAHTYKRKKTTP